MIPPKPMIVCIGVVLVLPGCGRRAERTIAPRANLPPEVVAVSPPSRATGVLYDTEIWADFAEPLDPATVNERSVFLKIDTRRFPIAVSYDSTGRRVRLTPNEPLQLRQTYTVELASSIAKRDGAHLDETYFWEFATNSLRRVENPFPAPGAVGRSPFTPLSWSGTEVGVGTIGYSLFVAADSVQVANHAGSPRVTAIASSLATPPWPMGSRLFWSVVAMNRSTGEEFSSAVWTFQTLAPGATTDSLIVPVSEYGYYRQDGDLLGCNGLGLTLGRDGYNSGIRWNFEGLPDDLQLAGATIELYTIRDTASADRKRPTVWAIQDDWMDCVIGYPGPPFIEYAYGSLALGVEAIARDTTWFRMRSDRLTSHMQGIIGGGGLHGYTLTTSYDFSTLFYLPNRSLRIAFYR